MEKKQKDLKSYSHNQKRLNNPPAGLIKNSGSDKIKYSFDEHLDPSLNWSGKKEKNQLEIDLTDLYVSERIDPLKIINQLKYDENIITDENKTDTPVQPSFFDLPENNLPLNETIEFYKHDNNWSNRLIAGDSLIVMNSLLNKENLSNKIQLLYIDPPYGIKYGSNFQPFINQTSVKDKNDSDITTEPEMIKAFRDTWELGIHSYLTFLRERLLLAKELLNDTGSCFVQISDENVHLVRIIMDEIFGKNNFVSLIPFRKKTMPLGAKHIESMCDYLIFYAKDISNLKYRHLYVDYKTEGNDIFNKALLKNGEIIKLTKEQINDYSKLPKGSKVFRTRSLEAPSFSKKDVYKIKIGNKEFLPSPGKSWITSEKNMEKLILENRILVTGNSIQSILFNSDFPYKKLTNFWDDTAGAQNKMYVVQTSNKVLERVINMCTDPGDIIFDPTCGSGITAYISEKLGRRWITCDTSRVSTNISKSRFLTSVFDYYKLKNENEGVDSGFELITQNRTSLSSVANENDDEEIVLYDKPIVDKGKKRVFGPFTVETIPSPEVFSQDVLDEIEEHGFDDSISRSGETSFFSDLENEIKKSGITVSSNERIEFNSFELSMGTKWIHFLAETKNANPERVVLSVGPKHNTLGKIQVMRAIEESQRLFPKPSMLIFMSFQFDPEASKEIDLIKIPELKILKVQINSDFLVQDLKTKSKLNQSFWLIGQPDVDIEKNDKGEFQVKVNGFDYLDPNSNELISGGKDKIALWMLDPNYDGLSFYPSQTFFSSIKNDWSKVSNTLKHEIDPEKAEMFKGNISLPFKVGNQNRVAVKIIDVRGIESIKIFDDL